MTHATPTPRAAARPLYLHAALLMAFAGLSACGGSDGGNDNDMSQATADQVDAQTTVGAHGEDGGRASIQAASAQATNTQTADTVYNAWIKRFLVTENGKIFFGQSVANHKQAEGWIAATDTMVASDVYERTHALAQSKFIDDLGNSHLDVNKTAWWTNYDWNDDIAWIAMAHMRNYQSTGNKRFLDAMTSAWNITYNKGWNVASGGGGIWERMGHTSKCGLSNNPIVTVGVALHQITGDDAYLKKSEGIYKWARVNLFNPSTGQTIGCVDYPNYAAKGNPQGRDNMYDNGSFLEAATALYRATGDTQYRDDAQILIKRVIANNPIMKHTGKRSNQWAYYFVRGLNSYCTQTKTCAQYSDWFKANADAAWKNRDEFNMTWDDWTQKTNYDKNNADALMMSSAVAIWQLLPRTSDAAAFPGTYQIRNAASKMALSVADDSTANSASIVQQPAGSSATALWTLVPTDNGYFQIKNVKTGKLLNVAGSSGAPGAKVVQWPAQSSAYGNDQWLPVKQSDGSYVFFNLNSHFALDNPDGGKLAGAQLSQWQASGSSAQRFTLVAQNATDNNLPNGALACFYADANYKGESFCAGENDSWVGSSWNDRISSVRIAPGYSIELFKDVNFGSKVAALTSDVSNLSTLGVDNTASSFKISRNGASSTN